MIKKFLIVIGVVLFLFIGTNFLRAQELMLFVKGNYSGSFSLEDSSYARSPNYSFVNSADNGTITHEIPSSFGGCTFGVGYFFNRHFGVSVSMGFLSKLPVDLASDYTFTWQFPGKSQYSESSTWTSSGDISVMPINLNLIYSYYFLEKTLINLTAGASLFLTKIKFVSNMGYGVGGQHIYYRFVNPNWEKASVSVVDFYELWVRNMQKEAIFGANVGLDIEQRFSRTFSAFAGFWYYAAPKKAYAWELIPVSEYEGHFGTLSRTIKDDKSNLPVLGDVTSGINISHFTIAIGIKVRFNLKK